MDQHGRAIERFAAPRSDSVIDPRRPSRTANTNALDGAPGSGSFAADMGIASYEDRRVDAVDALCTALVAVASPLPAVARGAAEWGPPVGTGALGVPPAVGVEAALDDVGARAGAMGDASKELGTVRGAEGGCAADASHSTVKTLHAPNACAHEHVCHQTYDNRMHTSVRWLHLNCARAAAKVRKVTRVLFMGGTPALEERQTREL